MVTIESITEIVRECNGLAYELDEDLKRANLSTLAKGSQLVKKAAEKNMDAQKKGKTSGIG